MTRSVAVANLALAAFGSTVFISCGRPRETDKSLGGVSTHWDFQRNIIENGSAFEQATIEVKKHERIFLPDDAEVRHVGHGHVVHIYMKKTLEYFGHGVPKSIRQARNDMGCAMKADGDALWIATFGEWDTQIEGGAYMCILIEVPAGVRVEPRKGLSGPPWGGRPLGIRRDLRERIEPGKGGWQAIPAVPDPEHRAKVVARKVREWPE
jgi:hypothetical protein